MKKINVIILAVILCIFNMQGANFTTGSSTAQKLGVHEIVLYGNGGVSNPFNTDCSVTFTPPSGSGNAKTVKAF